MVFKKKIIEVTKAELSQAISEIKPIEVVKDNIEALRIKTLLTDLNKISICKNVREYNYKVMKGEIKQ